MECPACNLCFFENAMRTMTYCKAELSSGSGASAATMQADGVDVVALDPVEQEQEAQRRAEQEEAARRKAQAEKSWLQQAIDMAGQAFENDYKHRALDQYKKSAALFAIALKQEGNEKVKAQIQLKLEEMLRRAEELSGASGAAVSESVANRSAEARPTNTIEEEAAEAARILALSREPSTATMNVFTEAAAPTCKATP